MSLSLRLPVASLTDDAWDQVNHAVAELERQWADGEPAEIASCLSGVAADCRSRVLVELIKVDQEYRWTRSEMRQVQAYLAEWPELSGDSDTVRELLEAECLTQAVLSGTLATAEDLNQRFHRIADQIDLEAIATEACTENPTLQQATIVETDRQAKHAIPEFDRYQILEELGHGGMGTVYRAMDRQLQREVALKVPRPELMAIPEARSRFIREAQAAAGVEHSHICPVYDAGEANGTLFITMKLIRGSSLADLAQKGPLAPEYAAKLAHKLARALAAIHTAGIVHRDIKPSNVMLDNGEPLLMDFGLARPQMSDASLTMSGALLGTALYMSPEQVNGERATALSDIYSLGAVLYQLLTGQPPFTGRLPDVMYQVANVEPKCPTELRPEIPPAIETVCLTAMAKKPESRFASAADFAVAIEQALQNPSERPATKHIAANRKLEAADRPQRGSKRLATLAMIALVLVAILIILKTGDGSLELSVPDGATVTIDGNEVAVTAGVNSYAVAVGEHEFSVSYYGATTTESFAIRWRTERVKKTVRQNVAIASNGTTATADSFVEPRTPSKSIDGNPAFGWAGRNGRTGWWMAEFPGLYIVDQVDILWDSHEYDYSVECSSDGDGWLKVVADGHAKPPIGEKVQATHRFDAAAARFLRINMTKTSAPPEHTIQASHAEVQVFKAPLEEYQELSHPLINHEFAKNLDGWKVYCIAQDREDTNVTPGKITWSPEHGGSAKVVVDGEPSLIDLQQEFRTDVPTGSVILAEVIKPYDDHSQWLGYVGGMKGDKLFSEYLTHTGQSVLCVTTNRPYPAGTSITLHFSSWPGMATFYVKRVTVLKPQ